MSVDVHPMPSLASCTCGLFGKKKNDKDNPEKTEEKVVEKPIFIVVPDQKSSATAPQTKSSTKDSNRVEEADPTKTQETTPTAQEATAELADTQTAKEEVIPDTNDDMDSLKGAASGVGNTVSSGAQQVGSGVQSGASGVQSGVTNAASTAQNTASSGAEKVTGAASNPTDATQTATDTAKSGTEHWDAMTEDQKKQTYDSLPSEQKKGLSYTEWLKQGYQHQKENWMPWIEDVYLRWFTKDIKVSYATKGTYPYLTTTMQGRYRHVDWIVLLTETTFAVDTLDKSKVTGIEQVDTLQDGVNNLVAGQVGQGGLLQPVGDMASKEGVNRAERGGKDDSGSYAGAIGGGMKSVGGSVWSGAASAGSYVGGFLPGGKKQEPAAEEKK